MGDWTHFHHIAFPSPGESLADDLSCIILNRNVENFFLLPLHFKIVTDLHYL